jgi:DNA-binding transcriptional regulator LsrR (DeoR family)
MNLYELLSTWSEAREITRRGGILSTNGRILVAIIVDPKITQIAISVMLGVSQAAIEKGVAFWEEAGIIEIHKQGRSNTYSVNWERLRDHPDYPTLKVFEKHDD